MGRRKGREGKALRVLSSDPTFAAGLHRNLVLWMRQMAPNEKDREEEPSHASTNLVSLRNLGLLRELTLGPKFQDNKIVSLPNQGKVFSYLFLTNRILGYTGLVERFVSLYEVLSLFPFSSSSRA